MGFGLLRHNTMKSIIKGAREVLAWMRGEKIEVKIHTVKAPFFEVDRKTRPGRMYSQELWDNSFNATQEKSPESNGSDKQVPKNRE